MGADGTTRGFDEGMVLGPIWVQGPPSEALQILLVTRRHYSYQPMVKRHYSHQLMEQWHYSDQPMVKRHYSHQLMGQWHYSYQPMVKRHYSHQLMGRQSPFPPIQGTRTSLPFQEGVFPPLP